ncbi:hypothetical protein KIPB_001753, partial [Kipferlia bialata]
DYRGNPVFEEEVTVYTVREGVLHVFWSNQTHWTYSMRDGWLKEPTRTPCNGWPAFAQTFDRLICVFTPRGVWAFDTISGDWAMLCDETTCRTWNLNYERGMSAPLGFNTLLGG